MLFIDGPDDKEDRVEDEAGVGGKEMCDMSEPNKLGAMCKGFQVTKRFSLMDPV